MSNIKDVAKMAGVSVATVSRVVNNPKAVATQTAERVLEAVNALGYSPNHIGKSLRRCKTNKILAILPNISYGFYSQILRAMQHTAIVNDYTVIACTSDNQADIERKCLELLHNKIVDGAILLHPQMEAEELEQLAEKYPIVLCCEGLEKTKVPCVAIDNYRAGRDAVEYLLSLGHRKIAMVTSNFKTDSAKKREQGYIQALTDHNIEIDQSYIRRNGYSYSSGTTGVDQLMALDVPPTAIFCVSDNIAIGAIKRAIELGINVGSELSIMGFDNTGISAVYVPSITTVSQPRYEIGELAINLLLKKIQQPQEVLNDIVLDYKIVVRESTGDYQTQRL